MQMHKKDTRLTRPVLYFTPVPDAAARMRRAYEIIMAPRDKGVDTPERQAYPAGHKG